MPAIHVKDVAKSKDRIRARTVFAGGDFGMAFRVVQPWGEDKIRQSTWLSEHETAEAAFREIDRLASEMSRTGAPSDAIELVVVDVNREQIVTRLGLH